MKNFILCCGLALSSLLSAQEQVSLQQESPKQVGKYANIDQKIGLAVKGNTFGLGADLTMPLNDRFSIRVGASQLNNYKADDIEAAALYVVASAFDIDFMGVSVSSLFDYQLDYKISSFNLLADWYITKNSPIHLTGGLRFSNTYFRNTFGITQDITILDGLLITPENFGSLTLQVDYPFILPYLGIGVGRLVNNKTIGFNFEIGNSFISGLDVTEFSGIGRIGGTAMEENRVQIEENLSWVWAHPNIEFSISYNFK